MAKQNNGSQRKGAVAFKHARVLSNMVENGGKSGKITTISKAARQAGYSEAYIRSGKLQKTKAWGELINDVLPEDELLAIHQQGLNAVRKERVLVGRNKKGGPIYRMVEIEDYAVRHKYLDTAYKLKKKYTTDITVHNKLENKTYKELEEEQADILTRMFSSETLQAILQEKINEKEREANAPKPERLKRIEYDEVDNTFQMPSADSY